MNTFIKKMPSRRDGLILGLGGLLGGGFCSSLQARELATRKVQAKS
ncbi:MAG: hypothetical protein RIR22_203, partial [Planctomycetota bacterium]